MMMVCLTILILLFFSSDFAFSPISIDNIHSKEVNSTNLSSLQQKSFTKIPDLVENKAVGKENIEEPGASRNIKSSTFKRMARL